MTKWGFESLRLASVTGNREREFRLPEIRAAVSILEYQGQQVWSKLNNSILEQVAMATDGAYVPAETKSRGYGRYVSPIHRQRRTAGFRNRTHQQLHSTLPDFCGSGPGTGFAGNVLASTSARQRYIVAYVLSPLTRTTGPKKRTPPVKSTTKRQETNRSIGWRHEPETNHNITCAIATLLALSASCRPGR